jgi:intermembrane space import and assembly protein 40
MIEEKRRQAASRPPPPPPAQEPVTVAARTAADIPEMPISEGPKPTKAEAAPAAAPEQEHEPGSPEALEHEATQQGAFDPETGEINWDCPCLGGMAHGPCGEEFKAAFSCFVYSKEEPKGMDCIEKFQCVSPSLKSEQQGDLTDSAQAHAGLLPEVP